MAKNQLTKLLIWGREDFKNKIIRMGKKTKLKKGLDIQEIEERFQMKHGEEYGKIER